MADLSIYIERVPPKPHRTGLGNSETRYKVLYNDEEIGVWRYPEHAAARKLLEMGAERSDVLHVFHGGMPSMQGDLGWWADRTIVENDTAGGPYLGKYRPLPDFDNL